MNNIKTENLSFSYKIEESESILVLNDISLEIPDGQFTCVLGPNGSGKSTLAKHFNSILLPSAGKVYVYSMDTADDKLIYDIRQTVGMVFQNPDNQIVATVVEEDVAFAPENIGIPPAQIRERVDFALNAVGMYEFKDRAPHQLSGGQKQRVAIAGIIAMKPKCIVLDEPTAMLDPSGRKEVLRTLKQLNKEEGITIILITHFMEEAVDADRVIVVDDKKILFDGTPHEVFSNAQALLDVGLEVPQTTHLMMELKENGFDVPLSVLTVDECLNVLESILK